MNHSLATLPASQIRPAGDSRLRLAFYSARFANQLGQGLFFVGLFWLVTREPSAAVGSTGVMAAMMAGSILCGIAGGTLADRLGNVRAAVIGALARGAAIAAAIFVAVFVPGEARLVSLVGVAFGYSAVSQLYCPAELSLVRIVEAHRPSRGHALLTVLQYAAQGLALLFAGILTWWFQSPLVLLAAAALCYVAVAGAMRLVAGRTGASVPHHHDRGFFLRGTLHFFRAHPHAVSAAGLLAFSEVAVRASAVALPYFLREDLGLSRTGSIALVVPGIVGAALGLLWSARWLEPHATHGALRFALVGSIVGLLALGAVGGGVATAETWSSTTSWAPVPPGVFMAVVVATPIAVLLGICFSMGPVAARALLTATAPHDQQSRVFATQGTVTDALGILPLLISGVGAQVAGGSATFVFLGVVGAGVLVALGAVHARTVAPGLLAPAPTSAQ